MGNSDGENLIKENSLLTDEMVFTNDIYRILYNASTEDQLLLFDLFINEKALRSITESKYCSSVIICQPSRQDFQEILYLTKKL